MTSSFFRRETQSSHQAMSSEQGETTYMPRQPRHYLSGMPYHIRQRGNNKEPVFFAQDDYSFYLFLWRQYLLKYDLAVHAYCLMTNHVHFLVTPGNRDSISNLTRAVGSRYAAYVNRKYGRTGSLWEGRHRSSLVETDEYLLTCYRYIELNPVRAGMTKSPADYKWSSYNLNTSTSYSWLSIHEVFKSLGSTDTSRCRKYRDLVSEGLNFDDAQLITNAINTNTPTARPEYVESLKKADIQ